jgi:hypothetical protein
MDQLWTSKSNDKKRMSDLLVANVEQPHHSKAEYQPRPSEYVGLLDGPKENTRLETITSYKASPMRFSNQPKRLSKRSTWRTWIASSWRLPRRSITYWRSWLLRVQEEAETHGLGGHGSQPYDPKYQKWCEVPITFDQSNHPNFIPKSVQYSLIVWHRALKQG